MNRTYEVVVGIIAETCDIDPAEISPNSHLTDDLGIDSIDFLDVAFAIDKAFGIKLPVETWAGRVNEGLDVSERYFVLGSFCERVDELVAAESA